MIRWVTDVAAAALDVGLVQLTSDAVRTDAHRFYERLGFVASHVGPNTSCPQQPVNQERHAPGSSWSQIRLELGDHRLNAEEETKMMPSASLSDAPVCRVSQRRRCLPRGERRPEENEESDRTGSPVD